MCFPFPFLLFNIHEQRTRRTTTTQAEIQTAPSPFSTFPRSPNGARSSASAGPVVKLSSSRPIASHPLLSLTLHQLQTLLQYVVAQSHQQCCLSQCSVILGSIPLKLLSSSIPSHRILTLTCNIRSFPHAQHPQRLPVQRCR